MATRKNIRLEAREISKIFPGVKALDNVSIQIENGEVHALVGENGAGKSTLVKIFVGAESLDSGEIYLEGEKIKIEDPLTAMEKGISIIYQEFNLFSELSIAENIFIGREPLKSNGLINWEYIYSEAKRILDRLRLKVDVRTKVKDLRIAQQQMVEIAKALSIDSKVIIMDEPSATLTEHELERLFMIISELKKQNISIIYISHRLDEIYEIADRVTVLRDGKVISTKKIAYSSKNEIIRMMVGRELGKQFPKKNFNIGEIVFEVKDLCLNGSSISLSLDLREQEILGITGLVGSGRTEFMRAVFGADLKTRGEIYLNKEKLKITNPGDAIKEGIALAPEDRKQQGLFLNQAVAKNITITNLSKVIKRKLINIKKEEKRVQDYIELLNIKTPTVNQLVKNLSGGNQQKVVLAKWVFSDSKVIIFDEPTRGIDVGAKIEIYNLMNQLLEAGKSIIMISSELPEIIGMSDRIMVMHEGKIKGIIDRDEATQEKIMHMAIEEPA